MTLPTDYIFPNPGDIKRAEKPETIGLYLNSLVDSLTEMYRDMAENINGYQNEWTPKIEGTTAAGTGTYTYQTGYSLRSGINVDVWFDIAWTGHTGTGDMLLTLPYKVKAVNNEPFAGVLAVSNITLSGGYSYATINAQSDTFTALLYQQGTNVPQIGIPMDISGSINGFIRYLGQEFENL